MCPSHTQQQVSLLTESSPWLLNAFLTIISYVSGAMLHAEKRVVNKLVRACPQRVCAPVGREVSINQTIRRQLQTVTITPKDEKKILSGSFKDLHLLS